MMPGLHAASPFLSAVANHLWQSTLCVAAAAWLVRRLKPQSASVRYRVWLLASLKFLIPFSLLLGLGRQLPIADAPPAASPLVSVAVHAISEPFALNDAAPMPAAGVRQADASPSAPTPLPSDFTWVGWLLAAVWAAGAAAMAISRAIRSRDLRQAIAASPLVQAGRDMEALERARHRLGLRTAVGLRRSAGDLEPGIVGIFRPVILWPASLTSRLSDAELEAILAHELLHVRRRDNLAALVHATLETVFWFHPLMWWIAARLVDERERACDEEVLRLGNEPRTYAAGILKVCDFCLQSPVPWAAGVTGSNLTQRVEDIMTKGTTRPLSRRQRWLMIAVALCLAAAPVALGAVQARSNTTLSLLEPVALPRAEQPAMPRAMVDAVAPAAPAQAPQTPQGPQATTGRLTGFVMDASGGVIPGATVTARRPGVTSSDVTRNTGGYTIDGLAAGPYTLQVNMPGFKAYVEAVNVVAGVATKTNVQLQLGAVTESITVANARAKASEPAVVDDAARELQIRERLNADPRSTTNYLDLARLYRQQGRDADAESMARLALNLLKDETAAAQAFLTASPAASAAAPPPLAPRQSVRDPTEPIRIGGDIKEPKKVRDVKPAYPPEALASGVQGMVIIEAIINKEGAVSNARVLRSVPLLDQAALSAVYEWRFTPTLLNGVPVEVLMTVTVNFTLPR